MRCLKVSTGCSWTKTSTPYKKLPIAFTTPERQHAAACGMVWSLKCSAGCHFGLGEPTSTSLSFWLIICNCTHTYYNIIYIYTIITYYVLILLWDGEMMQSWLVILSAPMAVPVSMQGCRDSRCNIPPHPSVIVWAGHVATTCENVNDWELFSPQPFVSTHLTKNACQSRSIV